MNDHKIHGRLVRNPDLTVSTEERQNRVNFTVAVDRRFGDETDFFDCVMFGKRAAVIDRYFSKGSEIILWGEGQIRSFTDKEGIKRKSYSIVVSDFDFCGSKSSESSNASKYDENRTREALEASDSFEEAEEDCPF